MRGNSISTRFTIGKRVAFRIKAPSLEDAETIGNKDIHEHRMYASPQEILSLPDGHSQAEARRARAALAKAYHTDSWMNLGDLELQLLNRRMQEINHAYDQVRSPGAHQARRRRA
jgi:DnaJ-domain-containing protein 1